MTIALLDADIIAYRSAASCEPSKTRDWVEPVEVAILRTDELVSRILQEVGAASYKAFLTGENNYRYGYNPEYKIGRKDKEKPRWLQAVREHLVLQYRASVADGNEADDELSIHQCGSEPSTTIICSIDKDLLCVPGKNYNFVTGQFRDQSPLGAQHHFWFQMLMGDKADGIYGFDGLARQTIPKKLQHLFDELFSYEKEQDMFEFVRSLYNDDERLLMNGRCLWLQQVEGQIWEFPK